MWRIRSEQFQAMQGKLEDAFVARMAEHLRRQHAPAVSGLSDSVLTSRISRSIAKARKYGFTTPASLLGFLILAFEIGPDFDRHHAFKSALLHTRHYRDQVARVEAIFQIVTDEQWNEAQSADSKLAWEAPERGA